VTKLSSSLPKEDTYRNGLTAINQDLVAGPHDPVYIVARIVCSKVTKDMFTGGEEATAMVDHIEVASGPDADAVLGILEREYERRNPRPEPLPGTEEFGARVTSINFGTGEIR
jgi:hypothetical protein